MAPVTPRLEFVFRIRMQLGIRQKFGPLPQGSIRGFVSAAGGTVEGPRLNGRVVPNSGGDWALYRDDHTVGFDARYMLEADDGTPISLSAQAQFFWDDFGDSDEGWYALAGASLFKKLAIGDDLALYPYVGFSLAAESYTFGRADAERAIYLTRQFGVHTQLALGANDWVRLTVEEHSFRRETYRAVRGAFVHRF